MDIIHFLLKLNKDPLCRNYILKWLLTAESIWKTRNAVCLGEEIPNPISLIQSIDSTVIHYQRCLKTLIPTQRIGLAHSIDDAIQTGRDYKILYKASVVT